MSVNPSAQDALNSLREALGAYLLPPLTDMTVSYAAPYGVSIFHKPVPKNRFLMRILKITQPALQSNGEWSKRTVIHLRVEGARDDLRRLLEKALNSAENGKAALGYFIEYANANKVANLDSIFATLTANRQLTPKLASKEILKQQIRFQVYGLFSTPNPLLRDTNPYYPQVMQVAGGLAQNESNEVRDSLSRMINLEEFQLNEAQVRAQEIFDQAREIVLTRAWQELDRSD